MPTCPTCHGTGIVAHPKELSAEERQKVCESFKWIGQSWRHCDDCGLPFWEHTHEARYLAGKIVNVRIEPEAAEACRKRWE